MSPLRPDLCSSDIVLCVSSGVITLKYIVISGDVNYFIWKIFSWHSVFILKKYLTFSLIINFLNHIFKLLFMEYDFEEERIVEEIKKRNARRVLLQLPEGLKKEAFKILEDVEGKTKAELIFSGRGCWGGCDLAVDEAKKIKADLLIHFGHAPFVKSDFPIVYIELYSKLNIVDMLEKEIKKLDIKKIGLIGSVQFIKQFDRIKICKNW